MKDETPTAFTVGVILGCVLGGILSMIISSKQLADLKKQAVIDGYAIWEVDNSGNTTFKWKENAE